MKNIIPQIDGVVQQEVSIIDLSEPAFDILAAAMKATVDISPWDLEHGIPYVFYDEHQKTLHFVVSIGGDGYLHWELHEDQHWPKEARLLIDQQKDFIKLRSKLLKEQGHAE